jgi:Retrotransposon gag protein
VSTSGLGNSSQLHMVGVFASWIKDYVGVLVHETKRASHFMDQKMQMYDVVGSLTYTDWQEVAQEFIAKFCPKNKIQTSRTDLETATYFQGSRTVDKYVDGSKEIVDKACYFEGAHIVLKFCQGLNANIQDHVACLTQGCPSDKIPQQWYDTAILCNENCFANTAFTSSPQQTLCQSDTTPSMGGLLQKPLTTFSRAHLISMPHSLPVLSVSSAQCPKDTTTIVCF